MTAFTQRLSTPILLTVAFSTIYFALGPGRFFSVDEVVVEETARAVYSRGDLEVPAMNTAIPGRGDAYYAHRGPALGFVAVPFVLLGDVLDQRWGSFDGGIASGSALGVLEHPLRWGGRLSVFLTLAVNALAGGLAVAMVYLIAFSMSRQRRIALWVSVTAGTATLLASEATHFFQHPLEALMLLLGFWFLVCSHGMALHTRAWFGGAALGLAILTRFNTLPAALVIGAYGAVVAWRSKPPVGRNEFVSALARGIAGATLCTALYLLYNYLQYGRLLDFGYKLPAAFHLSFDVLGAAAAYLFSPSLSVFLFAPPLLLVPVCLKRSAARWPLETQCILIACLAHFLLIIFLQTWHGLIAYGPRYMLAPILLLMPLTIPAFEQIAERRSAWRVSVLATIIVGIVVQLIGISVYVVVNEWRFLQSYPNVNVGSLFLIDVAYVFRPSASPVWVQFKDLVSGRNITLWAFRALSQGSPALIPLAVLVLTGAAACWLCRKADHQTESSMLPAAVTSVVAVLVLSGFMLTAPVLNAKDVRLVELVNQGLAAQKAGQTVAAQELYAIVLGLEPGDKYALHNLAILYEGVGKTKEAISLYQRALASDPSFGPAAANLSRYGQSPLESGLRGKGVSCQSSGDCYQIGKSFLDRGDTAGAVAVWREASERFPSEAWLARNVGWGRYQLKDYSGAVVDYERAARLAPADNGILTDLAWAYLRSGRTREARAICDQIIAKDSKNNAARAILSELDPK